ncbi:MAG TPA: DUF3558 domain-containing protein [Pseudonocardiaceae bacterium]
MRFLPSACLVAAAWVLLSNCGGETNDGRSPLGLPSTVVAASPIAPVRHPRDVSALTSRPCALLTSQQAATFGLDRPPQPVDDHPGKPACEWTNRAGDRISLSALTDDLTLESIYRKRRGFAFFELTEIAGYPATVSRASANLPTCDIDLKPAERQSVSLTYESRELGDDMQQACVVGKQLAMTVLMNLPPK